MNRLPVRHLAALAAPLGLLLLMACARAPVPVANVPIQANAAEQFLYAERYRGQTNMELMEGGARFKREREIVRQTYAKVAEYFPEDTVFTPIAQLWVIEMEAGIDSKRSPTNPARLRQGIERLAELAQRYPEHELVQAKSLYDRGMSYLLLKDYPAAQGYFDDVRGRYKNHHNPAIAELARRSEIYYNQTYIEE